MVEAQAAALCPSEGLGTELSAPPVPFPAHIVHPVTSPPRTRFTGSALTAPLNHQPQTMTPAT